MALSVYGMNAVGHTASAGGAHTGGGSTISSGLGGRRKKKGAVKRTSLGANLRRDHGGLKHIGPGPRPPRGPQSASRASAPKAPVLTGKPPLPPRSGARTAPGRKRPSSTRFGPRAAARISMMGR